LQSSRTSGHNFRFPPSKNGGPIEASDSIAFDISLSGFRRQKTAAPLKLNAVATFAKSTALFPPSKNGGPIEADARKAHQTSSPNVSAVKKRRPH